MGGPPVVLAGPTSSGSARLLGDLDLGFDIR